MTTNLNIDESLLEKATKLGGHQTQLETVNEALREYVKRREQAKIIEMFGTVDYDPDYDYKAQRRRS